MEIGSKILELRKKNNITQEKLAAEMGVSIAAVSKWENANSIPDIIMLCSLADYFGITTDELLGRNDKTLKFVVADDAHFICDSIEYILNRNKHKCLAKANNGMEVLKVLDKVMPDGIFLDINMPEMDGLTTLRQINEKYSGVKVIIITADVTEKTRNEAIRLGASAYITKPFMPEHIEVAIKNIF